MKTPNVKKLPQLNSEEQLIHITLSIPQAEDLIWLLEGGVESGDFCDPLLDKLGVIIYG